jgi:hypothetical protein
MRCVEVREQLPELALGDLLALLGPEVEPPTGFVERTRGRLRDEQEVQRRWPRRQVLLVAAAAIALVVVATLATVRIVDASRDGQEAGRVHEATMVGAGDRMAGRAYATEASGQDFLFVSVEYGVPAGKYSVDVEGQRGTVRVGTMTIGGGRGEWAGPSGDADGPPRQVRLVDAAGTTVCSARFGPAS